ncbi:hypothetical protein B0I37DRAFT_363335 [Chaetomium sp. MPI-CAGE-AT-0009]|nr:hypothetical protein B0I37DRAFT_363335 [Chaetomium sp. MPI-CAGE-AT-0009]
MALPTMAEGTHAQATLLGLPRELRLQILEGAIAVRRAAPASPSASKSRVRFRNQYDRWWSDSTKLFVEDADHAKSAQPFLLATSRQIREETQYVIGRLAIRSEPYQLDVMYVNGYGLMPSWVSLPCLSKRVGKLDIRFRFFDTQKSQSDDGGDDGGLTCSMPWWNTMVFVTLYILQACSRPGVFDIDPRSPPQEEAGKMVAAEGYWDRWCVIDAITITIESTNIPMNAGHPAHRSISRISHEAFGYSIFHGSDQWPVNLELLARQPNGRYGPELHFAKQVKDAIGLMDFSNTPYSLYSGLFLTNVGRVEILVDDDIYHRSDITKRFWELYTVHGNPKDLGWDATRAAKKRKRLGMWTEVGDARMTVLNLDPLGDAAVVDGPMRELAEEMINDVQALSAQVGL